MMIVYRKKRHDLTGTDQFHKRIHIIKPFVRIGVAVLAVNAADRFYNIFFGNNGMDSDVGIKCLCFGIWRRRFERNGIDNFLSNKDSLPIGAQFFHTDLINIHVEHKIPKILWVCCDGILIVGKIMPSRHAFIFYGNLKIAFGQKKLHIDFTIAARICIINSCFEDLTHYKPQLMVSALVYGVVLTGYGIQKTQYRKNIKPFIGNF